MPPSGRLNVFQRLARTWDAGHPYNAGQACLVDRNFAVGAIDAAWARTLRSAGLGPPRVGGARRYQHDPVVSVNPVLMLDADADLSRHFGVEINRPFVDPAEPPFRPFAKQVGDATWLGIVYQHWVADSISIRWLMQYWLATLLGDADVSKRPPSLVRRGIVEWPDVPAVLQLFRRFGDYRRVRKVQTLGPLDYATRVRLLPDMPRVVPPLLAYARSRRVTVGDVMLAALAEACDRFVPAQHHPGRRDLAVSSVVDLRAGNSNAGFGCLLGFRSTVCRTRHLGNWDRLLRAVAAQRSRSPGALWMAAAEAASRVTPPARLYDFYRKEAPFAGGISNVNLAGSWFAARHPAPVLRYVRVSPTGPMVPVALNVTSLGDTLHLSMTWRRHLFNDWTAAELSDAFCKGIQRVAG